MKVQVAADLSQDQTVIPFSRIELVHCRHMLADGRNYSNHRHIWQTNVLVEI